MIHSFFVPNFSEKIDAVPGIATTLRVTPTRIGVYPAECTELCGAGHSLMRTSVHVVSPSAFQSWLKSQKANGTPPIGSEPPYDTQSGVPGGTAAPTTTTSSSTTAPGAAQGKAVFTSPTAGCGSCHTLAAAGTTGTVGPNLGTDIVPQLKKAHQSLKQYIHTSIVSPNAYITPGFQPNIMPQNFSTRLTQTQINSLVDFISSVTK